MRVDPFLARASREALYEMMAVAKVNFGGLREENRRLKEDMEKLKTANEKLGTELTDSVFKSKKLSLDVEAFCAFARGIDAQRIPAHKPSWRLR